MKTTIAPPLARTTNYTESQSAELAISPSSSCEFPNNELFGLAASERVADYLELTKPRISVMVLLTVTVGYTLSSHGVWQWSVLLPTLLGVALVASASSAWNQWLERHTDARMERTSSRPLPSGRLTGAEVLMFGVVCVVSGTMTLVSLVNVTTTILTLLTLVLYVGVYTPLKRHTSFCTAIGAVPGALPPVLGWTAAGGSLDFGAFALFAILFLWQFPHFLAIAWLYREQYENAGLKMLPQNRAGRLVGLMAVTYAVVLIPASLLPHSASLASDAYSVCAVLLGAMYLRGAIRFACNENRQTARGLLFVSLIYLPCVLMALTFDHLRLLM